MNIFLSNTWKEASQKILIVDGDPAIQESVRLILKELGYDSDIVNDGITALSVWNHGYPLILMDIDLSDMNGLEVTKKIRSYENSHFISIVAMTSYPAAEYIPKCLAAGMDGFLSKPISLQEVEEVIAQYAPNIRVH